MPILLDKYVSQVSHQVFHAFHGGFISTKVQSWRRSHLDVPSSEFRGIRCWKIASNLAIQGTTQASGERCPTLLALQASWNLHNNESSWQNFEHVESKVSGANLLKTTI